MFSKKLLSFLGRKIPQAVIPRRVVSKAILANGFSLPVIFSLYKENVPKDLNLVVTRTDVDKTLDFMTLNFIPHDPLVRVMGIDDTDDLQRFLRAEISSGWTIKLVDKNSDIMALALCVVSTPEDANQLRSYAEYNIRDPKTKRLMNLWADIADSNNLFECFKVREMLFVAFMATAAEGRNRGIAKVLVNEAQFLGKQEGMSLVRGDCTSFFSVQAALSWKWSMLPPRHVLSFRDKEGRPWLPKAPPHPHGDVVVVYNVLT